jgi:signal transduction histidine kinase
MKERTLVLGGEFTIKSTMNSGTLIRLKIPINKRTQND